MINNIEEKRNRINLELRTLLSIINMIDGLNYDYEDYVPNTLNEEQFLDQQLIIVNDAKTRLMNVFKD